MLKGVLQGKPGGKRSKGWSGEGRATVCHSVPCAVRSGTRFAVPPKSSVGCDGKPLRASQSRVARSDLLQGGNWRREPTEAMPSARGFEGKDLHPQGTGLLGQYCVNQQQSPCQTGALRPGEFNGRGIWMSLIQPS